MTETLGFWVAAVVLVAASLAVVLTPNLFHAVLWLAAALVATGGVFLLLDSPFLFGVQLLLYAGGVVTIVVFAIMLTERLVGESIRQTSRFVFNGAVLAAAVFVGILLGIELMLNAVNINLVAFSRFRADLAGLIFTLFTIAITVAEVAVGLAIVIVIFRVRRTIEADHLDLLRG